MENKLELKNNKDTTQKKMKKIEIKKQNMIILIFKNMTKFRVSVY